MSSPYVAPSTQASGRNPEALINPECPASTSPFGHTTNWKTWDPADPSTPVYHPPHYTAGTLGIETIDVIRNALTPEEFRGYCKGNVLKYVSRERLKGGNSDLAKAAEYLKFLTESNR